MARQNQARVTATLDGVSLGVFETREGGETDSQETTYRLGGMGPRISLGGNVEVGNVTVRRLFDLQAQAQAKWILGRVGRGTMVVTEQPLNGDAVAEGEPFVWSGVLKRCALPERDADADDAGQIELEMTVSGQVG